MRPVVAPGGDLVPDVQPHPVRQHETLPVGESRPLRFDVLCRLVEPVDGLVRRGHQQRRLAGLAVSPPCGHGGAFDLLGGAAVESAFTLVGVSDCGVAAAELEGGGAFPVVGEAVDTVELDAAVGVDDHPEHPSPPDR